VQKFEYLVVYVTDSKLTDDQEMDRHLDADRFTEQLNKYGNAGWEFTVSANEDRLDPKDRSNNYSHILNSKFD
jgi:hypothetical protein